MDRNRPCPCPRAPAARRLHAFIPVFATRQDGSRIGLSLYRQIMRLHGGAIAVRSEPEMRTVLVRRF